MHNFSPFVINLQKGYKEYKGYKLWFKQDVNTLSWKGSLDDKKSNVEVAWSDVPLFYLFKGGFQTCVGFRIHLHALVGIVVT